MNNEPVAWIIDVEMTDCDDNFIWNTGNYPDWQVKDWIPLYTHPVNTCKHGVDDGACKECYIEVTHPVKELTDFEIMQISSVYPDRLYFARAILRKAQEK